MDSSRGIISVKLFAYKTFSQVYHRGRFIGQKYQSYFQGFGSALIFCGSGSSNLVSADPDPVPDP